MMDNLFKGLRDRVSMDFYGKVMELSLNYYNKMKCSNVIKLVGCIFTWNQLISLFHCWSDNMMSSVINSDIDFMNQNYIPEQASNDQYMPQQTLNNQFVQQENQNQQSPYSSSSASNSINQYEQQTLTPGSASIPNLHQRTNSPDFQSQNYINQQQTNIGSTQLPSYQNMILPSTDYDSTKNDFIDGMNNVQPEESTNDEKATKPDQDLPEDEQQKTIKTVSINDKADLSKIDVDELMADCVDLYKECPEFAEQGYCDDFKQQMMFQCRKTCNFCDVHPLNGESQLAETPDNEDSQDTATDGKDLPNDETQETNNDELNEKSNSDDSNNANKVDNATDEDNINEDNTNENNATKDNEVDTKENNENLNQDDNANTQEDINDDTKPDETSNEIQSEKHPISEDPEMQILTSNVKKSMSPSTKKQKFVLKPRSPYFKNVFKPSHDDKDEDQENGTVDNLVEKFKVPGHVLSNEDVYAETGTILTTTDIKKSDSSRKKRKMNKRTSISKKKQNKRTNIPGSPQPDPYQYVKNMDKNQSMSPIVDSHQSPTKSGLFSPSHNYFKKFFGSKEKRSSNESAGNSPIQKNLR